MSGLVQPPTPTLTLTLTLTLTPTLNLTLTLTLTLLGECRCGLRGCVAVPFPGANGEGQTDKGDGGGELRWAVMLYHKDRMTAELAERVTTEVQRHARGFDHDRTWAWDSTLRCSGEEPVAAVLERVCQVAPLSRCLARRGRDLARAEGVGWQS